MDKQQLLKEYKKPEDRIVLSQILDKIESKQKKAQCVPYFFTANKNTKKTMVKAPKNLQNKSKIVKK